MATSSKAPARKPASRSGNPATAAAAKLAATEAAEAARTEEQARLDAAAQARKQFEEMKLDAPVFDADGFEIVPDRTELAGGSYKFVIRGEHRFTLPNLQYLPLGLAEQLKAASTEQEAQDLIFSRYCPGLFDVASADEMFHIMKRWTDFSKGISLGE